MAILELFTQLLFIVAVTCTFLSPGVPQLPHHQPQRRSHPHHLHYHDYLHKRQSGEDLTTTYPTRNFTMPVDHFHNDSRYEPHTNRTFQQHYWFDDTYYKPGGPVIVNTMGEDGTGDLIWFQAGLLQQLANATGGMAVLWGQRYYAGSYDIVAPPYTTENLRFHSTEQAVADLAYFAERAIFLGHESVDLTAKTTPWIVIGGSYAGVISAFARIQYPDVFWGGLSSSGVTVAYNDGWQFYDAARRYGPKDCIANQQKLINIADNILTSSNVTRIRQLKAAFNATTLVSDHDFGLILSFPLASAWGGYAAWIPDYFTDITGPNSYCGNLTSSALLEPINATVEDDARNLIAEGGWGNETSTLVVPFLNFISTIRDTYLFGFCSPPRTLNDCWSTQQPHPFSYLVCTEYGQFATGYMPDTPSHPPFLPVASRLLNVSWEIENCRNLFNFSSSYTGPESHLFNKYGGFNMSYPRLALSTGEWDVYRSFGPLASEIRHGVPNSRLHDPGTLESPETVISHGGHEWDLQDILPTRRAPDVPPEQVVNVKKREIETVKRWLDEWKAVRSWTSDVHRELLL